MSRSSPVARRPSRSSCGLHEVSLTGSTILAGRKARTAATDERRATGDRHSYFRFRLPSYFSTLTNTPIST